MRTCHCSKPVTRHRSPKSCLRCLGEIEDRWLSSDENTAAFLGRVAALPEVTGPALHHAQKRERAGRETFGFAYLSRDNDREGLEEAADGLIYAALSWLCDRRTGREDIDPDLLDAAHHFALAHAALERRLARK
jgi:hypothetical protein